MATISFGGAGDIVVGQNVAKAVQQLIEALAEDEKQLDYVLNGNLDVKNIQANSITADRMDVTELSAITANMGKLTSGEIYGAYIATAEGTVPRIEFSSVDRLLRALTTATKEVNISPDNSGNPAIVFKDSTRTIVLQLEASGDFNILSSNGSNIFINANGNLNLAAGSGRSVIFQSWDKLYNSTTNRTLQQDLNSKASSFSGYSGLIPVNTPTGTIQLVFSNGILTDWM